MHSRSGCITSQGSLSHSGPTAFRLSPVHASTCAARSGNFWKWGLDPQEDALGKITKITDANWGQEAADHWGTLSVDTDGNLVTRPEPSATGDYRLFYAGVRDVLLGTANVPPVAPTEAWRVARVLEWARQSSAESRDIECDWSGEPV